MTNSLAKQITLLTLAAAAILFTGCKKDSETSTFYLKTSSLDFEWGQTKFVGYTAENVGGFAVITSLDGWTCSPSSGGFTVVAPAQGASGAKETGSITVTATRNDGTAINKSFTVAIRIAEDISARAANSIIVSEPGKRYKFNARRRPGETLETLTAGDDATVVWSTSTTALVNVSLENGYIYFATGVAEKIEEANAVLAVRDADDKVLWSWHIWMTDYDPAATPDVVDGVRVMNRNLGAFASSNATVDDVTRSYGLYYQWGRKDPFVGPRAWDSTIPVSMYVFASTYTSSASHPYKLSTSETGTEAYAAANPGTFIAGYEQNKFDWLYSGKGADRWSATSKSVNDPCPIGWRVAPSSIWRGFTVDGADAIDPALFNVEGEYAYGWQFRNGEGTVYYPAAGRRSFSPGVIANLIAKNGTSNLTNVVNNGEGVGYPVGFYWSADYPVPSDATKLPNSAALAFRRDYVNPAWRVGDTPEGAPASGFPLRCVAE